MAMSKRKKFKLLLTIEIFTILVLAASLLFVMKFNNIKRAKNFNRNNLAISDVEGFTNIMLFGVDARDKKLEKGTRSDTMILCSINEKTKEVSLTSFYRDYYAFSPAKHKSNNATNLSDKSFDKLTHAYIDGAEAAVKEININFDLDVQDFVTVNFIALVRIVDELDGIELNVKDFMVSEINRYGGEIARKNNEPFKKITGPGLQKLNGYQALGYARTRKKDSDFNRAQRQREVIQKVFEKLKSGTGILNLNSIINCVTDNMYTSFSNKDIMSLLKDAPKYSIREETNSGFGNGYPYNQTAFTYNGSSLVFSKSPYKDISFLHYNLFNNGVIPDELLSPSETSTNEGSNTTQASGSPEPKREGLNYVYNPPQNIINISNYLASITANHSE